MSDTFHLAVIPDGNRRWAKQNGLTGYKKLYNLGVDRTLEVTEEAFARGVTHLSLWGSSHANITARDKTFFLDIDTVYRNNINRYADHPLIERYDVKILVIGEWRDSLTPATIDVIESAMAKTAHRKGRILTLLLDYSGARERAAAALQLLSAPPTNHSIDQINHQLRAASWTATLPEVDLIIRTGAWQDPHNSAGFLSLLADEAQFAFPELLWPDFTTDELVKVLNDFRQRDRRKGN